MIRPAHAAAWHANSNPDDLYRGAISTPHAVYVPVQCDLQICCTPVQEVLNIQVNSCTNNSTKLDCACLESNVYSNSTVKTAADQCGCGCINCCYDALSAGSMTGCPASRCGIVTG